MKKIRLTSLMAILFFLFTVTACGPSPTDMTTTLETTTVVATTSTAETTTIPSSTPAPTPSETEMPTGDPELIWQVTLEHAAGSLAMHPEGILVAVGEYKVTFLYQLADHGLVDVIIHEHSVEDLKFSSDGSLLAAGQGYHGVLLTWLPDKAQLVLEHGHGSRIVFTDQENIALTGDRSGELYLWDISTAAKVSILSNPEISALTPTNRWIRSLSSQPGGSLAAAAHHNGQVYIWDLDNQDIISTMPYQGDVSAISGMHFSPDGSLLAVTRVEGRDHLIELYDPQSGELHNVLQVPERVRDFSWSPNGQMLAVASRLASTVFDTDSGELLYTFDQTIDPLTGDTPVVISFTPDGGHVLVARQDGGLELWRLPGAEPLVAPPVDLRQPPPLPGDLLFETNSFEIKAAAFPELEKFAADLYDVVPSAHMILTGHTDSRGSSSVNQSLSINRASAVRDWFAAWLEREQLSGWTFSVEGRGSSELKVPDVNIEGDFLPEAGALNRRVEIELNP